MNESVISVVGLAKRYESIVAVADVSFEVRRGEIFGILGRNGRARRPPSSACRACDEPMPGS